jgi:hypothetical protein
VTERVCTMARPCARATRVAPAERMKKPAKRTPPNAVESRDRKARALGRPRGAVYGDAHVAH